MGNRFKGQGVIVSCIELSAWVACGCIFGSISGVLGGLVKRIYIRIQGVRSINS